MFQLLFPNISCEFLGASSPKEEISMFLDFISSASLDPIFSNSYTFSPHSCFFQSIFIIFLSLSLSSISHPQSFSCGALMHAKARFLSVSHPIIINLSPTHKPITHMGWLVRERLSIRGRGICHVLPLVAPWLQGHKGCLAAPGTGHHHYSLLVLLLSQMHL